MAFLWVDKLDQGTARSMDCDTVVLRDLNMAEVKDISKEIKSVELRVEKMV